MDKETSSAAPSLELHQVLEGEFVALHGPLPPNYSQSADSSTRLKAIWSAIHNLKEKRAALCISGGGIRSATFALGILQGLARCNLLEKFHYLSTVSGGGYIGSWLSAWIKHHPQGADGVVTELKRRSGSALNPDPEPIRHLREFSNYLTPRTGVTSVDFWTLVATYLRNVFLNWLVLISWLAVFMMVPRLYLGVVTLQPNNSDPKWHDPSAYARYIQGWDLWLNVSVVVAFVFIAIAMAYAIVDVPSTGNARLRQSSFLKWRQFPLFLAALILTAWWSLFCSVHGGGAFDRADGLLKFIAFPIGAYLAGGLLGIVVLRVRKTERRRRRRLTHSLSRLGIIVLAAALAGFCLWRLATQSFLDPNPKKVEFTTTREIKASSVSKNWVKVIIPPGSHGVITQTRDGNYIVQSDKGEAIIAHEDHDALQLQGKEPLPDRFPVPTPARNAVNYVCFAPALFLAVILLVNFLFAGLTSWVTEDEDREWWGRSAAWILINIVVWIAINLVVLWSAQIISTNPNQLDVFLGQVKDNTAAKAILGAFGGVGGLAGALLALRSKLSRKPGRKNDLQWILVAVAVLFLVLLSILISWALLLIGSQPWVQAATKWMLGATSPWQGRRLLVVCFLAGVIAVIGLVMGFFINANKFSLHAIYRNRLIRAYLGASRPAAKRKPHFFTGFDPADNFKLHELRPGKLFHVINGAINLVRGEQLAWQERKAESFTMSRLHCGSWHVGYRPSDQYGSGISLGTALAISGAAANPNMGYHSSPIVGFLMTLFNVRLGWWLGSPGASGAKTWRRTGPGYAVGPLFSEAIGNTTDRYKYVNLSDGGHFENLGLYEMVLRRCHYIVVSDAGEDPECSFVDLGEAIRKIRIDFGIPIEFGPISIYPRSEIDTRKGSGHYCAIGQIRYSIADGDTAPDGVLVYIKPACYGDEPRDIYEYFKTNLTFPHETTVDQFFSESQFESYRMLGAYTMDKLCADCAGDLREFVRNVLASHLDLVAPPWLEKVLAE